MSHPHPPPLADEDRDATSKKQKLASSPNSGILILVPSFSLSELLGSPVVDNTGGRLGSIREVIIAPQEDANSVWALIVKTDIGRRMLPIAQLATMGASAVGEIRAATPPNQWLPVEGTEGLLLLDRDLLDQQIIDINGRKVVRVNDVDFLPDT